MKNIRIAIITGLSGSGKSTALRALEDIGYFCVDNLPIELLPKLLEMQPGSSSEISKIALGMDIRGKYFLEKHTEIISALKAAGYTIEVVFLEASDEALIHRYSETRRSHPLSENRPIIESIEREREKLSELKQMADNVIDTSLYNVHELKELIQRYYLSQAVGKRLVINLISFGYRYGLPPDADIVIDVRFLPNPYFVKELSSYNGNDKAVVDYVLGMDESRRFLTVLFQFMAFLTPLYEKEGKTYLNIALGCTGGKHRSVVIINQLATYFTERDYHANINHRDIERR